MVHKPPVSSRSYTIFITKGIGTESFAVLTAWEFDEAMRAVGAEAPGAKRYSTKVKRPSGGIKESDLSRVQRWSLVRPNRLRWWIMRKNDNPTERKGGKNNQPRRGGS